MSGRQFRELDVLIQTIARRPTDIDKLFCSFHYMAHNVRYSFDSKSQKPAGVFLPGTAVCAGYSALMHHLATGSGIKDYRIENFSNLSKAFGYDPLNPPPWDKSTHASVLVFIDGYPWLSDPTWAAGHLDNDKQFHKEFSPRQFLRPRICALHDHFPMDGAQQYLTHPFPYERFVRIPKYRVTEFEFRNEAPPFFRFGVQGYEKVQFSVNHKATSVVANACSLNGNETTQLDVKLQKAELLE
jgi:transglutaminase/protease-like cytokinesis protein 3